MKTEIIERLGQTDLLLPSLIAEGLAANDRVKVRLSILQAAARRVRDPQAKRFDLANECRAAGIDPVALEAVVDCASLLAGERITAPGLGSVGTAIWNDVETMVLAVKAGDAARGDSVLERLSAIRGSASLGSSDDIELSQIARLMRPRSAKRTSSVIRRALIADGHSRVTARPCRQEQDHKLR